jgi:endo-1,3-1,4-beta-glycanase ExoK
MSWFRKLLERLMGRRKPPAPPPPTSGTTFSDNFASLGNWTVSTWTAPQGGRFQADRVNINQGMLCLILTQTQNADGTWNSIGGEVACKTLMGFGTYEMEVRASSTAATPTALGNPVSGSITGIFNYVNDSQTEIDFEVEGNSRYNLIQVTNWKTTAAQQSTQIPMNPTPEKGFHKYRWIWSSTKIDFYVDGLLVATHTQNIPVTPAYMMFNHWGTTGPNWGGPAQAGTRYVWVKNFSFTAA